MIHFHYLRTTPHWRFARRRLRNKIMVRFHSPKPSPLIPRHFQATALMNFGQYLEDNTFRSSRIKKEAQSVRRQSRRSDPAKLARALEAAGVPVHRPPADTARPRAEDREPSSVRVEPLPETGNNRRRRCATVTLPSKWRLTKKEDWPTTRWWCVIFPTILNAVGRRSHLCRPAS